MHKRPTSAKRPQIEVEVVAPKGVANERRRLVDEPIDTPLDHLNEAR